MALFKSKQTKPPKQNNNEKEKPSREILSSNFKKVLAIVERQDQKHLATVEEKLKR